mgnify:CR=1 FL=1
MFPPDIIQRAAEVIRRGGLVAFPTETVYGLGANALDAQAVARIFEVKGRPSTSPLIVHVDTEETARSLAASWPPEADRLAEKFWPGPLTLVLEKDPRIPAIVTAGLPTVGIRMPAHPAARALIRAAGVPIAAPSANRFAGVSPTTAAHVRKSLGAKVDFILDGGPTNVGIESTVLSLAGGRKVLLRPGMVTREMIEAEIGPVELPASTPRPGAAHPSPGMHQRHYSPVTPLILVREGNLPPSGHGAYVWRSHPAEAAKTVQLPDDPRGYAANLYRVLHDLDGEGFAWIAVEAPPETPEWAAIRDRLRRASNTGT